MVYIRNRHVIQGRPAKSRVLCVCVMSVFSLTSCMCVMCVAWWSCRAVERVSTKKIFERQAMLRSLAGASAHQNKNNNTQIAGSFVRSRSQKFSCSPREASKYTKQHTKNKIFRIQWCTCRGNEMRDTSVHVVSLHLTCNETSIGWLRLVGSLKW